LRDDAGRANSEMREKITSDVIWEDYPLSFGDHVKEFFFQKVEVVQAGLVGTSLDCVV
jgi:hypothetical protein